MDLPRNPFKRALQEGRPQIGLWSQLCSPLSAEVLGGCGYDWLVLDMEHAPNELGDILAQLQALQGSPTAAVVRPPWNDMVAFKRLLDVGAQTLLVPYIQSEEEARQAVAYTRYPPAGVRGLAGSTRASRYGRVKDYIQCCADEICLLLQVETVAGLQHIEAIASVEGVDGIFIGPADLSASMGLIGNPRHPQVLAAIDDAMARIKACGKAPGILTTDEALARHYLDRGALFVALGLDLGLLQASATQLAGRFKT